jgi:hypothetical protein
MAYKCLLPTSDPRFPLRWESREEFEFRTEGIQQRQTKYLNVQITEQNDVRWIEKKIIMVKKIPGADLPN